MMDGTDGYRIIATSQEEGTQVVHRKTVSAVVNDLQPHGDDENVGRNLFREAQEHQHDFDFASARMNSDGRKGNTECKDCEGAAYNAGETLSGMDFDNRESAGREDDGAISPFAGVCTEDDQKPTKEDDIWSDEALISSQVKGFPPPLSILANESHPGFPSHMPRTIWRSVKRDGRFVLQEMQARPREFFRATRENGRLRLQLIRPDSDPVDQIPGNLDDLQLSEEADLNGNGTGHDVSNQNAERLPVNENKGTNTTVENADSNDAKSLAGEKREVTSPVGNTDERQDFQPAALGRPFGFGDTPNILPPSQTFLPFPFSNIQPAVR